MSSTVLQPVLSPAALDASDAPSPPRPARLVSLDAYRGAVMLLMASEVMRVPRTAAAFPDSRVWQFFNGQLDHVAWAGACAWDMIQPSFMFMVGVALPFSLAARRARGQGFARALLHAVWRSLLLIAVGIFLRSVGRTQTYFIFTDVTSQIGLGYLFLFLLAWTKPKWQAIAAGVILLGYWLAFAVYPAPGPGFDFTSVGIAKNWPHHPHGFAAHWDINTNLAARFDRWFLNLFPRSEFFHHSKTGGYQTLNFIPSLATMIFGLLAGGLLRSDRTAGRKLLILLIASVAGITLGALLHVTNLCPIVKRIWTPSWALFAGGITCAILAAFYAIVDVLRFRRWTFPLVVVGMNSIAMYCMAHLLDKFIVSTFHTHLDHVTLLNRWEWGRQTLRAVRPPFLNMTEGAAVLLVLWLICYWLYRKKLFLRL